LNPFPIEKQYPWVNSLAGIEMMNRYVECLFLLRLKHPAQ
jgi:hypothetical protein